MAPCEFSTSPTNIVRGSCVSERSRCGAVRISKLADEPSAGIVRIGALSLWRRANLHAGRRTLCGDRACRSTLAVAPCEFARWSTNPLRGSCVSERSRCGAVRTFYVADRPSARIVPPCAFARSPTNPLRGTCVSERSHCGAVRTLYVAYEPSAGIVRVGALSLWRRANFLRCRRTLCGDRACRIALAVAPCEFARWPTNPLRGSCSSRCGTVRICTLADERSAGSCVSERSRCGFRQN